jgi:NAD(P)-dependent dehydrogenase (short-subunit alcohol dehydrogenase family)
VCKLLTRAHQNSLTLDGAELHSHIDTNVIGPAEMVKQLVPRMSEGAIIFNMTSGLGSFTKGIFDDGKTVYAISKTAISMLSAHQAANLADRGIKVIVMDPGHVKTVSA